MYEPSRSRVFGGAGRGEALSQGGGRCFVSQPTLSGQLRKLEDELGVILIERTSRKVLFTPAGDAMAQQARKVLKRCASSRA